jgi:hypothetical protein
VAVKQHYALVPLDAQFAFVYALIQKHRRDMPGHKV